MNNMLNPQISTDMKLQFGEMNITSRVIERLTDLDFTVAELETAITEHKANLDGEPAVYCGTYAKYNDGNLRGLWVDLSTFDDYDEFINFCYAINADEDASCCELMFQDFDSFPRQFYSESCFDEETFDNIKAYSELCDKYSTEAVDAFMDEFDSLDEFDDKFCGQYASEEEYAEEIVAECYDIERQMGSLAQYFDYERFVRDLFMFDYLFADGYVFRRY